MRLRRLARLPVIAVLMLLGSCSPLQLLDAITADGGYKLEADIAYGTLPRERLDIYRPLSPAVPGRPVLVFFYGGSWNSGDRGDYRFIGQSFASAGYVTVVADYRLSPAVKDFISVRACSPPTSATVKRSEPKLVTTFARLSIKGISVSWD